MALDFGDAGLFDPSTPQNGKKSNNGNKSIFSFEKNDEDDENENVRLNGGDDTDDDRDIKDDADLDPDQDDEEDDLLAKGFPLDILDCIKGYEEVSFEQTSVPPPPFEEEEPTEIIEGVIKKEEGGAEDKEGGEDLGKEGDGTQEGAAQQEDTKVSFWESCHAHQIDLDSISGQQPPDR